MSEKASISNIRVGDHITKCLWTDAYSYTVVRITKKFVEVVCDKQSIDREKWSPDFHPGGFVGHTSNNYSQVWKVETDLNGKKEKFGVRKDGLLCSKGSRRPDIIVGAHPFYDYNF